MRSKWPHWRQVDPASHYDIDESGGCWIWRGAPNSYGYGQFMRSGVSYLAHRWFYERHVEPIPEGMTLDHLCRIRICVNPAHLEPVTNAENVRRGLATKLTAEDVRAIREWQGPLSELVERYGIKYSHVCNLRRRKPRHWANVLAKAEQS